MKEIYLLKIRKMAEVFEARAHEELELGALYTQVLNKELTNLGGLPEKFFDLKWDKISMSTEDQKHLQENMRTINARANFICDKLEAKFKKLNGNESCVLWSDIMVVDGVQYLLLKRYKEDSRPKLGPHLQLLIIDGPANYIVEKGYITPVLFKNNEKIYDFNYVGINNTVVWNIYMDDMQAFGKNLDAISWYLEKLNISLNGKNK
jgi:hypothetical protein